jgi:ABC-2 type transport system permease protein
VTLGSTPGSNLWFSVWKLLRLRGVIFVSGFRRARLRNKIGMVMVGVVLLAVLVAAFVISFLVLNALRSPELAQVVSDPNRLLASIPVLVVTIAFLVILITSFGLLLQSLYLAGDMDFLLSSPLSIRAVFLSKLLQAILPNYALILLIGLPVLFGLGASQNYNFLYYPLVILVLTLLAFTAAGIASLVVMAVVRVFPARRVAEVLGFLVAIISIIWTQSGQLANYAEISGDQAALALNQLGRINSPYSPLTWVGGGLVAIGQGRWLIGAGLISLTLVLTGSIFAMSLSTAERLYFSGWASVRISTRQAKRLRRQSPRSPASLAFSTLIDRLLSAPVRAILAKDFLVLRRDLRSMSQLITPLIIGIVYAVMLVRSGGQPPAGRGEAPAVFMEVLTILMLYANVGISLFIGWGLLSRLAGMSFSLEGKQYWLLKSAPVSTTRLITGKYLVAYLPTLILCWAFLLITSLLQRVSLGTLAYSLVVVALTVAGVTGLNLAFGVIGANFEWEDPRRISQGALGCLGALVSGFCLLVCLLFFFGPPTLFELFGSPPAVGRLIGMVLGSAASLCLIFVPLWLVRQRIPRLAE